MEKMPATMPPAPERHMHAWHDFPYALLSDPFGLFKRLGYEFDRSFPIPHKFDEIAKATWTPQVEMAMREDALVVRADLPGVKREDITTEIDGNMLTIKGERRTEHEEKTETKFRSERMYGGFWRSFRLPETADGAKAKAAFKDGVLEVVVPLEPKPEAKIRKLAIETHAK